MPRALSPHRIWLYQILAAAMLAAPLLQYTDSGERLGAIAAGAAVLTLIAYGEIFASVRRGTRILRAMHGQRDLMYIASVNPLSARRDIRRDLWQNGGWVALGALWVGRFALALSLAQYLFRYSVYAPQDMPFAHVANLVLKYINFPSYISNQDPVWWQRTTAAIVLFVVLFAETRMMTAIGMTVYLRTRKMQRWAIPTAVGARIGLIGFVLLLISSLPIMLAALAPNVTVNCTTIDGSNNLKLAWHLNDAERAMCSQQQLHLYLDRAIGGSQVGLVSFIDGGALAAADIMRLDRSVLLQGQWFEHRVFGYSGSHYYYWPSINWYMRTKSPLLPTLQMAGGAGGAALLMTAIAQTLLLRIAWRYGKPPS